MGISRDSRHKKRATGGRMPVHKKKRMYEMGRQPSMTKLGSRRVKPVRVRGGNFKYRALRTDVGNYSWGSESVSRKTRLIDVVYNATNNELVRTKTLVKNTIILIDATPFKQWYLTHYGVDLGKKKEGEKVEEVKKSKHVLAKQKHRNEGRTLAQNLADQFKSGRLLACISSRPGQSGRADGYILEGKELEFYQRKLDTRKKK